jgi:hypothetical protein
VDMRRKGELLKCVLVVLGILMVLTLLSVWILPARAMPQAAPVKGLPVFCAERGGGG